MAIHAPVRETAPREETRNERLIRGGYTEQQIDVMEKAAAIPGEPHLHLEPPLETTLFGKTLLTLGQYFPIFQAWFDHTAAIQEKVHADTKEAVVDPLGHRDRRIQRQDRIRAAIQAELDEAHRRAELEKAKLYGESSH